MNEYKNYSAETTHPNTKETDALRFVEHTVRATNDKGQRFVRHIFAIDPIDAMQRAQQESKVWWRRETERE